MLYQSFILKLLVIPSGMLYFSVIFVNGMRVSRNPPNPDPLQLALSTLLLFVFSELRFTSKKEV
jgi:hypothetical protein